MGIEKLASYGPNTNYATGYAGASILPGNLTTFVDTKDKAGNVTVQQPINVLGQGFIGEIEHSYFNDYYNRIWAVPNVISFGEISSTTNVQAFIWNAYLTTVTVANVNIINGTNIFLTGLILNQQVLPLATLTPLFTTDDTGPEFVNATYNFTFSIGGVVSLQLTGTRTEAWNLPINWAGGYEATYEFKTDEILSRSGKSQRRGLRNNPRRTLSYASKIHGYDSIKMSALLAKRQARPFTIPDEHLNITIRQNLTIGQSTLTLPYIPTWVTVGVGYYLENANVREKKIVQSILGNVITWTAPYAFNHLPSTRLKKIVIGYLSDEIAMPRRTNTYADISIDFELPPGEELPWNEGSLETLYEGLEVLLVKPNWISGLDLKSLYPREELDYGKGIKNYGFPINYISHARVLNMSCYGAQEIERLVNFFRRQKGRLREFWVPSWENDIPTTSNLVAGSNNITATGRDLARYLGIDTVHRIVYFQMSDGTYLFRRVATITNIGDDSLITFTTNFPSTILRNTIVNIGWMFRTRFASDLLTVSMRTDAGADIDYPLITLEVLA